MKTILLFLVVGGSLCFTPASAQDKQAQPTAQQKLAQTCDSIKSGELKDPPAQLTDACRTLEEERAKKKEQAKDAEEFLAGKFCGAPWSPDSPESVRVNQLLSKLAPTFRREYPNQTVLFLTVKSPIINAWTITASPQKSLVCVPTGIIDFLSGDGELAFIMGHETGHAVDQACKIPKNTKALQRACETRADTVGFDLLVKSGFSPYDAGAAFGKIEMYLGDTNTDLRAKLMALGKSHPMTPERIRHMRDLQTQYNAVLNGPLAH
ncbi:MAG: M48 family metallopeptidase [Candidatus Acidiferrum sp.]